MFGYPFKDEKCYSSFVRGEFETKPIPDGLDKDIDYKKSNRLVPMARGFLNVYSGNGYEKLIKIDTDDENFF